MSDKVQDYLDAGKRIEEEADHIPCSSCQCDFNGRAYRHLSRYRRAIETVLAVIRDSGSHYHKTSVPERHRPRYTHTYVRQDEVYDAMERALLGEESA